MKGKLIYVPATVAKYLPTDRWGYTLNWWEPFDYFQYRYTLVSAYYMKGSLKFREHWNYPSDYFLMGDSGGFQIASKGVWINPEEIMRWHQRNANVGMCLDNPPYKKSLHLHKVIDKDFEECLNDSIKMTNKMMKLRKSDNKCELYNILHGRDFAEMEKWYNGIKNVNGTWEGWALAVVSAGDLSDTVRQLIFAMEFFKTNVHILGIAGYSTMPIMAYAAHKGNMRVTTDSATYVMGAESRVYHLHGFHLIMGTESDMDINELPCVCPVCTVNDVETMRGFNEEKGKAVSGRLLSLHNLWQMIDYNRKLNALVNHNDTFRKFVHRLMPSKNIPQYLDVIDQYLEHGYEWIKEREVTMKRLDRSQQVLSQWGDEEEHKDEFADLKELFGEDNVKETDKTWF